MNNIISVASIAWIVTQGSKVLFGLIRYGFQDKTRICWRILWAGGMPSSHSAVIAATTLTVLISYGVESLAFGLSLIMSFIVVYDRCRMYSIYNTFQEKFPVLKEEAQNDPILKDLVGHRIREVIVGILIGLGVAIFLTVC